MAIYFTFQLKLRRLKILNHNWRFFSFLESWCAHQFQGCEFICNTYLFSHFQEDIQYSKMKGILTALPQHKWEVSPFLSVALAVDINLTFIRNWPFRTTAGRIFKNLKEDIVRRIYCHSGPSLQKTIRYFSHFRPLERMENGPSFWGFAEIHYFFRNEKKKQCEICDLFEISF